MLLSQDFGILFHLVFIRTSEKDSWRVGNTFFYKAILSLPTKLLSKCAAVTDRLPGFLPDVLLAWKRRPFCLSGQKEPLNLLMLQALWGLSHSTSIASEPITPGAQWTVCGHQLRPWKPHLRVCRRPGLKPPVLIQFCLTGQSQYRPTASSPSTTWSTKRGLMIRHLTSLLRMLSQWW